MGYECCRIHIVEKKPRSLSVVAFVLQHRVINFIFITNYGFVHRFLHQNGDDDGVRIAHDDDDFACNNAFHCN